MLHHAELKILFGVLHMFYLNLKPSLNLELKTLEITNRKGIRKFREKEKGESSPAGPAQPSQVARPRACAA
jgi:hypothetical protein